MKALVIAGFLTILSAGLSCFGQDCDKYKPMIAMIDSICRVKEMDLGMVHFHRVTSYGESTSTDSYQLSKKQEFRFEGQFLVMGGSYFNLDKLLFFFIREDYIDFYFQGY